MALALTNKVLTEAIAPREGTRQLIKQAALVVLGIAVFFADGRAFHRFVPAADTVEADHWCDPDTYKVRYDFSRWPVWQAEWRVTGPRKDYVMQSVYTSDAGISPKE